MDILYEFIVDNLGMERDSLANQAAVFYVVLGFGGAAFYLFAAAMAYLYVFIYKRARYFPSTVKLETLGAQVLHEIWTASTSIPLIAVAMTPAQMASYRGYSRIYRNVDDYGVPYMIFSSIAFILFTDCLVYWAHRGLHHPLIYRRIHKPHHNYRYTTPFSSHAFHPIDGFGQGVPYYIAIYVIPMHSVQFLFMFFLINIWTIMIHDQVDLGRRSILNTTGHHTIHHVDFVLNYGQYTTFWDRVGGTYKPAVKTHSFPTTFEALLAPEL